MKFVIVVILLNLAFIVTFAGEKTKEVMNDRATASIAK